MANWQKHAVVWIPLVLIIATVVVGCWGYLFETLPSNPFTTGEHHQAPLILTGPAAFTLLALIIAFAVYLRQVSSKAMDMIMNIQADKESLYPAKGGLEHTAVKLNALHRTHSNLDVAAVCMILLIAGIVARIFLDVFSRFPGMPDYGIDFILPLMDLIIILWVFLLFLVLGIVHVIARHDDRKIREMTNKYIAMRRNQSNACVAENKSLTRQAVARKLSRTTQVTIACGAVLLLIIGFVGQQKPKSGVR